MDPGAENILENKMKIIFILGFVCVWSLSLNAQAPSENAEGVVSFLSSQNTYVKYKSTAGLLIGDTLYTSSNSQLIPALIIKNLSSSSVVCSTIGSVKFNVNDKIIAKRRLENKKAEETKPTKNESFTDAIDTNKVTEKVKLKTPFKQNISGGISISSFSNFSKTSAHKSQVINYSLAFNVNSIANSKFSFESNILFRQEDGQWSNTQKNIFNSLKIYNLGFNYEFSKNSYVFLGRKINPNMANIGVIDGLQVEKSFKNLYIGGILGSRPHYLDYGYNFNLLQYGAYIGLNLQGAKRNMQNSIAILEQTNNSKTDRRFLSFQHSSSLIKNIQMFYTLELDLYKVVNEHKQNTVTMTNTYFSLRYRPFRRLTLSGTYDSRKNIVYYETYKNYLNTLIESEARQGYGIQANLNIAKNIYIGIKGGYRFQKKDQTPTRNAYMFFTHNNLFKSQISTTLSATLLETVYLKGNVYSLRLSRGFISERMNLGLGYSYVSYNILHAELPLIQHIADVNISTEIIRKLYLSINFESDFEKSNQFHKLYLQLRKRF